MTTSLVESLNVRIAILTAMKADLELTALIPSARWYPDIVPADVIWPFGKIGSMFDTPNRVDCADGADVSGAIHCFAKASTTIPDPQAFCITVNRHVARVLEAMDADIHVRQAQEMQDGAEAGARHGFVSFECSAV